MWIKSIWRNSIRSTLRLESLNLESSKRNLKKYKSSLTQKYLLILNLSVSTRLLKRSRKRKWRNLTQAFPLLLCLNLDIILCIRGMHMSSTLPLDDSPNKHFRGLQNKAQVFWNLYLDINPFVLNTGWNKRSE